MSVINQVLKDLGSRDKPGAEQASLDFAHSISVPVVSKKRPHQYLAWFFPVAALFVFLLLWQKPMWLERNMEESLVLPVNDMGGAKKTELARIDQRERITVIEGESRLAAANQGQSSTLVLADGKFEASASQSGMNRVTEIAWQFHGSGVLELKLMLEKTPDEFISTKIIGDREKEFVLSGVALSAEIPLLASGNKLIERYQISSAEKGLIVRVKAAERVKLTGFLHDGDGLQENTSWTIRAEPVSRSSTQRVAAKKKARSNVVAEKKKVRQSIKKPIVVTRTAESEYQQALRMLDNNRVSVAIKRLQKALAMKPALHPARELLANLYLQTGRETDAFMLLEQGVKLEKGVLFAKLHAQTLIQRGRLHDARNILLSVQAAESLDADYFALLAVISQRLGNHQQATTYYMRALELEPAKSRWWAGLAISLDTMGQSKAAIGAYNEAKAAGGLSPELLTYADARLKYLGSH